MLVIWHVEETHVPPNACPRVPRSRYTLSWGRCVLVVMPGAKWGEKTFPENAFDARCVPYVPEVKPARSPPDLHPISARSPPDLRPVSTRPPALR